MPSKPFYFKHSDYELALVTPTYRGSTNNVYVVTRVCDDLTPESCFPNEDFETFTHYYKEKHGLTIENLQQSMLEVKPIPVKINYIKPRYVFTKITRHLYVINLTNCNFQDITQRSGEI